jgi:hypothetical protein
MDMKNIVSISAKKKYCTSSLQSFFLGFLAIVLSNIIVIALAEYFGVHRPPINIDYLLAIVLLAFGFVPLSILLLTLFVIADILVVLGQVFVFIRPQDIVSLISYLPYTSASYKIMMLVLLTGVVLLVLLVTVLGKGSNRVFVLVLFNLCAFFLAYQQYTYNDNSTFSRVDKGLLISSQTNFLINQRLSLFAANVYEDVKPLKDFTGQRAVVSADWIGDSGQQSDQRLLIINESWGKPVNEAIEKYLISLLQANHAISSKGEIRFNGATVSAELKELCSLLPDSFNFTGEQAELQQCLPQKLKREGYTTRAIHGAVSHMYDRRNWYPQAGFQQTIFQEELIGARQCYSFPGACDVDTLGSVEAFFAENQKGFLYWLTLNTHARYDERDIIQDYFDCRRYGVDNDEICRYFKLQAQFFAALGQSIVAGHLDGVDILMVGDHEPRLTDQSLLDEYFISGKVPWIRLQPGH